MVTPLGFFVEFHADLPLVAGFDAGFEVADGVAAQPLRHPLDEADAYDDPPHGPQDGAATTGPHPQP